MLATSANIFKKRCFKRCSIYNGSSSLLLKKNKENPFLLLMGCTHSYSFRASSNPSTHAFSASRTEYSLAASPPELKNPANAKKPLFVTLDSIL